MNEKEYAWSLDGENYDGYFKTVEDAIGEAIACGEEGDIWIGEIVTYDNFGIEADDVIEAVYQKACDVVGEFAEGWLHKIPEEQEKELEEELNKVWNNWIKKYKLEPRFFTVENVKKYDLEKETFVGG